MPPSPKINGPVRLTVFLHPAACPTLTLGWAPQGPGLFPAECTRLGLPMFTAGTPLSPSKATHGLWMRGGGKGEEEGASLLKDPLNLLRCAALLPSTLCRYKLEVTGALWGAVLAQILRFSFLAVWQREMFGLFLLFCITLMNLSLVTASVQAILTGTSLECSEACHLPTSLTPSVNPKPKPFPRGSQGSWFWWYTPTTNKTQPPQLPWKSRLSLLFVLEGIVAAWIHLSQFMQLWRVHTFDLACRRFLLC